MYTRLQELQTSRAAAHGSSLPFASTESVRFALDPLDSDASRWPDAHRVLISPGYFAALGVRPLGGRDVEESDREGRAPVALVNQSFALTFARREDLIGRPIRLAGDVPVTATIVGIVPDLSVGNFRGERPEAIYLPLLQQQPLPSAISIVARATSPIEAVERQLRGAVAEIDSELQAHIGRHLKASYDDILGQDVPDRFLDLLKQLESKEAKADEAEGGDK